MGISCVWAPAYLSKNCLQQSTPGMPNTCYPPKPILRRLRKGVSEFYYFTQNGVEKVSMLHEICPKEDFSSPLTTCGDFAIADNSSLDLEEKESLGIFMQLEDKEPQNFDEWCEKECPGAVLLKDRFHLNRELLGVLEDYLGLDFVLFGKRSFNQSVVNVNEEDFEIVVEPEHLTIGPKSRNCWVTHKGPIALNNGIPTKYWNMALFICSKTTEKLNELASEYIKEFHKCLQDNKNVQEINIPWKEVRISRRLICSFMEFLWQWLSTFTDVAVLARGVSWTAPEVTNWAHLMQYPSWKDEKALIDGRVMKYPTVPFSFPF